MSDTDDTTSANVKINFQECYIVRPIPGRMATYIVMKYHYLHRPAPISYAYGLFDTNPIGKTLHETSQHRITGVVTFGTPCSPTLRCVCGDDEMDNMVELNRLFTIDDGIRNKESWFLGQVFKQLPKEIIVSYADSEFNHVGYIYQATNFLYTGLTDKYWVWNVIGENFHKLSLEDRYTIDDIKRIYGDRFQLKQTSQKYRYVYFNADKRRTRELLKKLTYPITKEYPKLPPKETKEIVKESQPMPEITKIRTPWVVTSI